jgi:hypothetical protein
VDARSKSASGIGIVLVFAVATAATAGADPRPSTAIRALTPEADTYVSAARPETNFGASRSLRVDGSPTTTAYLKFRLRRLQGEITSVTLLLHARGPASTSYEVRRVYRDGWRERRLTFESSPLLSLRYVSSKPVRRGAWSAVDVTSFVKEDVTLISLAVTTRSARGVVFESRESDHGPRLVVRTRDDTDSKSRAPLP